MENTQAVKQFIHDMEKRSDVVSVSESGNIIMVYVNKPVNEINIQMTLNESEGKIVKLIPPMHG